MRRTSLKHCPYGAEGGRRRWEIPFQLYRGVYQWVLGLYHTHVVIVRHN